MGKKIIVAGAGHGGIAAAAILAKNGYDVTVYEKGAREDLGYDWTDIFEKRAFEMCEMSLPDESVCLPTDPMTFYSPSLKTVLRSEPPKEQFDVRMERKEIYKQIIDQAISSSVKFVFETEVKAPVLIGNRIVGIETDKGIEYADLVIDAAGINSPLRSALPEYLGIQTKTCEFEQFYVYRAFFNKTAEVTEDKFRTMMLYENKLGICWVAAEEEYTDVLIGRFEPFDINEVNSTLESLRTFNQALGTEVLRGGQFVNIPVRQPLAVMVADGYAAIGDSAFMTVPVIGSGIASSLKAGKLLADAVMADKNGAYSAHELWAYQKSYYDRIGSGMIPLACIKLMLTRLTGKDLDYIFDNGILNANDLTVDPNPKGIASIFSGIGVDDIKVKLSGIIKNKDVLQKVIYMGKQIAMATAVTSAMPAKYDRDKVLKWARSYNNCFRH